MVSSDSGDAGADAGTHGSSGFASRQLQLGFVREGVPAHIARVPSEPGRFDLAAADLEDAGLVVIGGRDGRAVALVRRARELLAQRDIDAPIVFAGQGVARAELEAAGADEVVLQPAYLRDVVTIGRLLRGQPSTHRSHLVGNLAETTGVLTLVRALSALGRSAVLTLMRGLRRGEVRFYEGEVTSAQVGLIHGQAALHQLLLWTEARFDYHHEMVVRRQQIPLGSEELFADAERFLAGVRESSGSLSPSMVLEQDVGRIQMLGTQIPTEVHGVLRMFDGHRVLADVLEDSPYRLFETLRVAQRALDVGLLRKASTARPKTTWRAVLSIEEWLVGNDSKDDVRVRTEVADTAPVPKLDGTKPGNTGKFSKAGKRRKRMERRANTPLSIPVVTKGPDIDWGSLVPRTIGAEVGPLAGVVPSANASGEIVMPTREAPREKLEALMDTGKRERIFPTDIGLEPSVMLDEHAPTQRPAANVPAAPNDDATRERAIAQAQVRALVERQRKESGEAEAIVRAAEARATAEAHARAEAQARVEAQARAEADARAHAEADAKERAEAEAWKRAAAEAKAKADAAEAAAAKAKADATEAAAAKAKAEHAARELADEEALTRRVHKFDLSEVTPMPARAKTASIPQTASDLVKRLLDDERSQPVRAIVETADIVVTETPTATVAVRDAVSITHTAETARLVATPIATVSEVNPWIATPVSTPIAPPDAPVETHDDPSDGVVRSRHGGAQTAPVVARRPPPGDIPADDRPALQTGEIAASQPVVVQRAATEPSILVADIAAVQSAISAVATAQAAAPATPSIATPARETQVREVRRDATGAFTPLEENFFREGLDEAKPARVTAASDSFDDLDDGYQPTGFWDRLLGRKPPRR